MIPSPGREDTASGFQQHGRRPNPAAPIAAAAGAVTILGIWALIASRQPTVVVASPAETLTRLGQLASTDLPPELARTGWRAARGTSVAVAVGTLLGLLTGRSSVADGFLRATRAVFAGAPPIITVVLVSIWVGLDGDAVPYVVGIATVPIVWLAAAEATRNVDADLVEMAEGLPVSHVWVIRHVVVPAILPSVRAAAAYAVAAALRITIMAELFVADDGVGARIARARTVLDTPEVFAWALVAIAAALLLELVALRQRGRVRSPRRQARHEWALPLR